MNAQQLPPTIKLPSITNGQIVESDIFFSIQNNIDSLILKSLDPTVTRNF